MKLSDCKTGMYVVMSDALDARIYRVGKVGTPDYMFVVEIFDTSVSRPKAQYMDVGCLSVPYAEQLER